MPRCPDGHDSFEVDYCSVCGTPMPAPAGQPPVNRPAAAGTAADGDGRPGKTTDPGGVAGRGGLVCPVCGMPAGADAFFCESCGYDYLTGSLPRTAHPVVPAIAGPAIDSLPQQPVTETPAVGVPEPVAAAMAPGGASGSSPDRSETAGTEPPKVLAGIGVPAGADSPDETEDAARPGSFGAAEGLTGAAAPVGTAAAGPGTAADPGSSAPAQPAVAAEPATGESCRPAGASDTAPQAAGDDSGIPPTPEPNDAGSAGAQPAAADHRTGYAPIPSQAPRPRATILTLDDDERSHAVDDLLNVDDVPLAPRPGPKPASAAVDDLLSLGAPGPELPDPDGLDGFSPAGAPQPGPPARPGGYYPPPPQQALGRPGPPGVRPQPAGRPMPPRPGPPQPGPPGTTGQPRSGRGYPPPAGRPGQPWPPQPGARVPYRQPAARPPQPARPAGAGPGMASRPAAQQPRAVPDGESAPPMRRPAPEAPSTLPAQSGAARWVAEIWIDPEWYRLQQTSDRLPSPGQPIVKALRKQTLVIGRGSSGARPDLDAVTDSGVSRRQAMLVTDGSRWFLEDLGSSNGTYIGQVDQPMPTEPIDGRVELGLHDRIYIGSWTRIVVRPALVQEADY